jgi:hypothetical protein
MRLTNNLRIFLSLWRKSTRKPEETGIKAVIAEKTAVRWEQ